MAMKKVCVVEDNPDNRLLVRTLLEDMYTIQEYVDGKEALEGMKREKPDLVLLDISLPDMDGPEVLQHMRADVDLQGLPVIALTAHAMGGDREKYLAQGFDEYITKPIIDEDLLFSAIEKLLSTGAG